MKQTVIGEEKKRIYIVNDLNLENFKILREKLKNEMNKKKVKTIIGFVSLTKKKTLLLNGYPHNH